MICRNWQWAITSVCLANTCSNLRCYLLCYFSTKNFCLLTFILPQRHWKNTSPCLTYFNAESNGLDWTANKSEFKLKWYFAQEWLKQGTYFSHPSSTIGKSNFKQRGSWTDEGKNFVNHEKHAEKQAIFLVILKVYAKISELVLIMAHFKGTVRDMRVELWDIREVSQDIHLVIKVEQMYLPKWTARWDPLPFCYYNM